MTPLLALAALALLPLQGPDALQPKEYWMGILRAGGAPPAGEDATALLLELSAHLGSRDAELRDDCGYGLARRWLLDERLVDAAGARRLMARWVANLEVGLGEEEDDSVLLRSFSALDLSLIAARDLAQPFLSAEELRELLGAAVAWLEAERDLRGWVPEVGWHHAPAHGADLLRALAQNPRLGPAELELILYALAGRASAPVETVLIHGEDDRMARAVVAVLARPELDPESFRGALEPLAGALAAAARGPFDPVRHATATNARNLLRALYVRLAAAGELEPPQAAAREAVLALLAGA